MTTDSFEPPEPTAPLPSTPPDEHEPMVEGDERPPRGVKIMAVVRWCLLGLAAIVALSAWWSYASAELQGGSASEKAKYHCPMHPQIVSDDPGECPICHMRLEPIASHHSVAVGAATTPGLPDASAHVPAGTAPIILTLDRIQSIGVRTAVAGEGDTSQTLRVTAIVAPTEQGVAEVHVRSPGFVERLLVNQTGVAVGRDQPLLAIYSSEILQAQSELLATHRWASAGAGAATAEASRRKLELLGMASNDIDKVLKTGEPMRAIPVYSPQAGYVTKKNLVAGSYVTPDMALYEIQDLSQVYVVADVFQRDVGFLRRGTPGRFVPTRRPDQAIDVRIDLVYPMLNPEARTTRVRMQAKNPRGVTLRPGEYGTVEFATPGRTAVTVPRDAVVDTGLHTYVFVVMGEGVFSPREVVVGEEHGELLTILAGISPGNRVVSGATFLIDSESRLQAAAAQVPMAAPVEPKKKSPEE